MIRARFILLVALAALGGCAAWQRSDDAAAAKKQMIGLSSEDVLACMGAPKKKAHEGAIEVWSYLSTDYNADKDSDTARDTSYAHAPVMRTTTLPIRAITAR